jgi:hypothetical protein
MRVCVYVCMCVYVLLCLLEKNTVSYTDVNTFKGDLFHTLSEYVQMGHEHLENYEGGGKEEEEEEEEGEGKEDGGRGTLYL